jgi:PAS domain S-box-containing protein
MTRLTKISLFISAFLMLIFLTSQSLLVFHFIEYVDGVGYLGMSLFLATLPFFGVFIYEVLSRGKLNKIEFDYQKKLKNVIISQSKNSLFYEGRVNDGARLLTREVTKTIDVDRCSVWLYNDNNTSILCKQLYVRKDDHWYSGMKLFRKDYKDYFIHLEIDPVIIANDAEKHSATSCFLDSYLKPLGIKSMLDVPITYLGETIGVICIESLNKREWKESEINFAQMLSTLYSFAYSIKEGNNQRKQLEEIEKFIEEATLVSKTNEWGKIIYANKKFIEVSGWDLEELLGKDHNIVNSGKHPTELWKEMYRETVKNKKVWNYVVTNRAKDGHLYYVDTYIKAEFNPETGELVGFTSIRQDVSELKRKEQDIRDRMNAINQSNIVIEFDVDGYVKFANQNFCDSMGYKMKEIVGKHHSIFVEKSFFESKEYTKFWNRLKKGDYDSSEFKRLRKDGSEVWLQATYNPIFDSEGNVVRIMKIATDVTDKVLQSIEIEKKNTYLEHAAKILRHDMHSGINTYLPRGVNSLERRLSEEDIKNLKIEAPLKMIKEGLKHSQKVYKGVYEFTNLVKKDVVLNKEECNIKEILADYLSSTSYKSQVILDDNLPVIEVNEPLFCTSIDNLIRNGLKYNDSDTKWVKVYLEDKFICVEDNGRGMTQKDFEHLSKPYVRKKDQKEAGTGLGLNICIAILKEHRFTITCHKIKNGGTKLKIKIYD